MRKTHFATAVLLVGGLFGGAARAFAQEEAPPVEKAPDRWKVGLDFGFTGASGNNQLAVLTTGIRIKRLETTEYELEWSAAYRYGESEGDVIARSVKSSLSFDMHPQATWSPFLTTEAERDPFLKLDLRTDTGGGGKLTFFDDDHAAASISGAVLHHYENYTEPRGADSVVAQTNARWSFRAKAFREFPSGLRIENTSWYKPVYDHAFDYNVDSTTKASVRLSRLIGLKFSYTFRRDSTPAEGVDKNDQIVEAGISFQF